jgi:hypothetical protein
MGIVYLSPFESSDIYELKGMIAPTRIPLLGGVDILNRTFCIIAEGLTDDAFEKGLWGPTLFPDNIPAAGLFKRLRERHNELPWAATLKPYSWRASPWWELPAPIMITSLPQPSVYHPFLVILIGDAPSMTGNDPIYVSGEIGYTF